jgi:hypothetical protein
MTAEKKTTAAKIFLWVGVVLTVIGAMTVVMFCGEMYDGILGGSRSNGITRGNDPLGFYLGTAGQLIFGVFLLAAGISLIRNKQKTVEDNTASGSQK